MRLQRTPKSKHQRPQKARRPRSDIYCYCRRQARELPNLIRQRNSNKALVQRLPTGRRASQAKLGLGRAKAGSGCATSNKEIYWSS